MKYDYLIVGCGVFGSTFAERCKTAGKICLVIDKRDHIAGNVYSEKIENIDVHKYGPHILNSNNEEVWRYIQRFAKINQYVHRVKVNFHGSIYSMPINLQTFYEIYGTKTPEEALNKLNKVCIKTDNQDNIEDWCLANIGPELYNVFVKHYTVKQWMKSPKELPASIIKRLPVRLTYDDRWHQSTFSGIPADGYTAWIANMLDGIKVELGVNFFDLDWKKYAHNLVYSGPIDRLFDYCYGDLNYRTLRFESKTLNGDYQGVSQMNYTDNNTKFTRVVEHKHFNLKNQEKTVVTWEYPEIWKRDAEPYYPINDDKNNDLYTKYKALIPNQIIVGGRLGSFRYMDVDACIASALKAAKVF